MDGLPASVWDQAAALGIFAIFAHRVIDVLVAQQRRKNGHKPISREEIGDLKDYVCKWHRDDRDEIRDLLRLIEINTRRG